MPTKKIFSKKLSNRIPILLWLLPAILLLILFAFSTYYRTDKFNTEYSNTSDKCMAYQKLYNKMLFGCSYPIIKYGAANDACYDTLETDPKTNRKIYVYGFKDLTRVNDSVYTSEIKFYKDVNRYGIGPRIKMGKTDPAYGDLYRPKCDSIYLAVNYLYYKKWIYCILIPGMDTVALRKKVLDIRNSFDFSETHLKEPTFSPAESTAIISALSLLLLACLLVGYRRVRSSLRSRKAKAVYFLHVLCLYALISVYLCLPDICFTSWMRGGLLCLLFTCLGIGILLSMFRKALHKR